MSTNADMAWTYRTYDPETAPGAGAFGPLSPTVALWRSRMGTAGELPLWRDFDILDFEGWWGQLSLAELHRDPIYARWVLWGTWLVDWWGKDYTNQVISQQPYLGSVWEKSERPYLEQVTKHRLMGFITGTLGQQQRDYVHVHGVDLPLGKDGVVTHVMSAYRLREADDDFVPDAPVIDTF